MISIKDNANIVLRGSWNLSILNPTWFAKEFPELNIGKEIAVEMELNTQALRFTVQNIIINPNLDRLIFFSTTDDAKNYESVEKLAVDTVKKLPHTPIRGIGHNISYIVDGNFELFESEELDKHEEFYKAAAKTIALNSQEIKHSLAYENFMLNLTYNINRQKNFVSFNFHYEVKSSEKIEEYLKDFRKNIEYSKTLYDKLLKK
ncbi:MAG: hypothetical protein V3R54_06225 [Thermodesulfovibrionia bacterium]